MAYDKVGSSARTSGAGGGLAHTPLHGYVAPGERTAGTWKWLLAIAIAGVAASQAGVLARFTTGQVQAEGDRHANGQPRVTLYSAVWCGYCRAARDFFVHNGVAFTELDIETNAAGKEGYAQRGGGPIPMILVGSEQMRGFNPTRLQEQLSPWMTR